MNKIGIYYAYWAENWDVDFHPYVDKVADLGFDVLEVNAAAVVNLSSTERRALKTHAEDRNLELTYCVGLPAECDPASELEGTRRAGVELLQSMAQAIGEMGGGILGGILYGKWPGPAPATMEDRQPYLERSLKSMRQALPAAEDNDVIFCLEVVNRFEQYLMNTAEEGVAYLQHLDSPNAKLLLDTFHMNIEEASLAHGIKTAGTSLGHLHIGENQRMPPGRGHLDWHELAQALEQVDYQGRIVMEPFMRPGGEVGRDIRVYRDLSQGLDLDQEAARSLRFMRKLLCSEGI